jgi:hypothetical protein
MYNIHKVLKLCFSAFLGHFIQQFTSNSKAAHKATRIQTAHGASNLPTHFPTPPKSQNHQAWSVGVGQPRTDAQAGAFVTLDRSPPLSPCAAARDSPLTRRQVLRPAWTLVSPASPRCRFRGSAPRHRASPRRRAASQPRRPLCLDSEVIKLKSLSFSLCWFY